jgi:phosphatidylglycerophosphate synthase
MLLHDPAMQEELTETRIHTALTANLEQRILIWLAERLPTWVSPDHLTALALIAQIAAGAAYAGRLLWLVNLCLVLNWFGDSLDGTVARVRNQQRPRYGFYVDHIADAIGAFALMAGLGFSGYIHWPIAIGMLLCFYLHSIESYLATHTIGRFHVSRGLFGPTEIRILLAIANIFPGSFNIGGAIAIAGMTAMLVMTCARHTALLYREGR